MASVHTNGSSNPGTDHMTIPFEKSQKDEAFAHTMFKRVSTLPAGDGAGTMATSTPYSFAAAPPQERHVGDHRKDRLSHERGRTAPALGRYRRAPAADSGGV